MLDVKNHGPIDVGESSRARQRPFSGAVIEGGFWGARQALNHEKLLLDGARRLEQAGALDNLRVAAGLKPGAFQGERFHDSDVYKWLEALGWELGRRDSAELAALADDTVALLEAAQDADGYLNSFYQLGAAADERWSNLASNHELYCAGHLIQAAVAHARARGSERLLGVARRFADHLVARFGPGQEGFPGHPEAEMALVELARLTGDARYRELAGLFLDRRGHAWLQPAVWGSAYFQDHVPVREQRSVEGHAVRALYLASGMVDVYLETGEPALLHAAVAQWEDMAHCKAYVTGGVGARHEGEAFGDPYELPADRSYSETCAAIASIMFSWRLLLVTGEARYADLIERTLYNGFLSGLALDGGGYAYVNPLHVRDAGASHFSDPRPPWHGCACCPPNVMRMLASLQHYLATLESDGGVRIHQYTPAVVGPVRMVTDYPWSGRVAFEALTGGEWSLSLRVPAWCESASLDAVAVTPADGYVTLRRSWSVGERVILELDMPPRFVTADPRIDDARGCVAVERGPLVYCLEAADLPAGVLVDDVVVDAGAPLRAVSRTELLGGVAAVEVSGAAAAPAPDGAWPYGPAAAARCEARSLTLSLVPYAFWGNRGRGGMRVWLPDATFSPAASESAT